jgi:hypothetical protein
VLEQDNIDFKSNERENKRGFDNWESITIQSKH